MKIMNYINSTFKRYNLIKFILTIDKNEKYNSLIINSKKQISFFMISYLIDKNLSWGNKKISNEKRKGNK